MTPDLSPSVLQQLHQLATDLCGYHNNEGRPDYWDEGCVACSDNMDALSEAYCLALSFHHDEVARLTARAIVAEKHRTLELLSKGSATEQLEKDLRIKLAEAELRAEQAEVALSSSQERHERFTHEEASDVMWAIGAAFPNYPEKVQHLQRKLYEMRDIIRILNPPSPEGETP